MADNAHLEMKIHEVKDRLGKLEENLNSIDYRLNEIAKKLDDLAKELSPIRETVPVDRNYQGFKTTRTNNSISQNR